MLDYLARLVWLVLLKKIQRTFPLLANKCKLYTITVNTLVNQTTVQWSLCFILYVCVLIIKWFISCCITITRDGKRLQTFTSPKRYFVHHLLCNFWYFYWTVSIFTAHGPRTDIFCIDCITWVLVVIQESPGSCDLQSIQSNYSNAASDASWDQMDDPEVNIVRWVPDHTVTHCAGCDTMFTMLKRKHHCR